MFRPDWYREDELRDLVMAYYFALRQAMRSQPRLRPCLTRCRHCRIFFISHPRNRQRRDLGCPFGCRDAIRRQGSAERCAAYYQTPSGKAKKARQNRKRRRSSPRSDPQASSEPATELSDRKFAAEIVEHVRVVTSLIEGFEVSREAVIAMLQKTVRQRSIVRERRHDYELRWLFEHPP